MKKPNFKTLLILIFVLQLSLFAIPESQDSIYNKLINMEKSHFESKRLFNQINNDTLLLKIAIKLDNGSYLCKIDENYFKNRSLLRIKNRSLIWDKLDSIKLDYLLMDRLLSNADESACKKFLLSKHAGDGGDLRKIFIKKKIIGKIKDPSFLFEIGLFKDSDFNMDALFYLKNLKFTKKQVQELLNKPDIKDNEIFIFSIYILQNFDDFIKLDFSKANAKVRSQIYSQMLNQFKLNESDLSSKPKGNLKEVILNGKSDLKDRALALIKINKNEIDTDMFKILPTDLKMLAILRTNDESMLYSFFESSNDDDVAGMILVKINEPGLLKKIFDLSAENDKLLNSQGYSLLYSKFNDDKLIYNNFIYKKNGKGKEGMFTANITYKDDEIRLKLLKLHSETYPDNGYGPYSNMLFGLKNEKYMREIIFGDFHKRIKDDVIPLITDEKLLSDIMKSNLDISYKSKCVTHPYMTDDSLLYKIASEKNCDFELAKQIAKKLNDKVLNDDLSGRDSNPEYRKNVAKRINDPDSLFFIVLNDPDKKVRMEALDKISDNNILRNIYFSVRNININDIKGDAPGYTEVFIRSLSKINDQKILYEMALERDYDYRILENNTLTDTSLIFKLLMEKLKTIDLEPPQEYLSVRYRPEMILIGKLENDSLLEIVSRQKGNEKLILNIIKYASSSNGKKYLLFTFKHTQSFDIKDQIIKKLSSDPEYLLKLLEIEKNGIFSDEIKTLISKYGDKIEAGKKVMSEGGDFKDFILYFENDQPALKWLYENAKATKSKNAQYYKDFAFKKIEDTEFLSRKLCDYEVNSAIWKEATAKLKKNDILYILNSSDYNMPEKENIVGLIKDNDILKEICFGNYPHKLKDISLKSINDGEILYEFYLKFIKGSRDNFNDFYQTMQRMPDIYLLKIMDNTTDPEWKKSIRYLIKDQKLIEGFIREFKDGALISKITDYNKRHAIFWEITDNNFRREAILNCRSKNNMIDIPFFKRVLTETNNSSIKFSALALLDDRNNIPYFIEYFNKDTTYTVREKILSNMYREFQGYNDNLKNDKIAVMTNEFINKIAENETVSDSIRKKAKGFIIDRIGKNISKIESEKEILSMIETEQNPQVIKLLLFRYENILNNLYFDGVKLVFKDKYYDLQNDLVMDFLKKRKNIDDQLILPLIGFASDPALLRNLYGLTENNIYKNMIIAKIKDEKFLESIIRSDNQDTLLLFTAFTRLEDQKLISDQLKKYSENEKFIEILLWRCTDKKILKTYIESSANDTIVLIAKLKKELTECGSQNFLDKFFEEWNIKSLPKKEDEIKDLGDYEIEVYKLYEAYLSKLHRKGYKFRYILLPNIMKCSIDSSSHDTDESGMYRSDKVIEICDFRPSIPEFANMTLYSNGLYRKVLEDFIRFCPIDLNKFKPPKNSEKEFSGFNIYIDECDYKSMLLRRNIPIYKDFNNIIHNISIYIDEKRTMADLYIDFYSKDRYQKVNGKWILVDG